MVSICHTIFFGTMISADICLFFFAFFILAFFFLKEDLISEDICTAGFNSLGYLRVCRVRIRHLYLRQGLGFRVLGLGFTV